jgi:outer membrane biosynthesis protein TonB
MLPQAPPPKEENSTRVSFLLSVFFHVAIVAALVYFAAREGFLGQRLHSLAVEMVKEAPPEKPKEEPPKVTPPKLEEAPKLETAKTAPAPETAAPAATTALAPPPAIAPAAAEMPSVIFDGGGAVQTSTDPVTLYKGSVESAFLARWHRPSGIADDTFVDEVEVAVDRNGNISAPVWKKNSGNSIWDDSVKKAVAETRALALPPPPGFPTRVLVRFDVAESTEPTPQNQ